eukprot:7146653-Alexandrium_andersonii.AAC.1
MVQGQPNGWAISPIREYRFDLSLVQGTQSQGMKLSCNPESNNRMPPSGQPGRTAALVAVAGPESE